MPRTAKDKDIVIDKEIKKATRKTTPKNEEKIEKKTTKKAETKTAEKAVKKSTKKAETKPAEKTVKKSTKKAETKPAEKSVKKSTKKAETKSAEKTVKKIKSTKTTKSANSIKSSIPEAPLQVIEYYDLPYKYGNTVVKLLAQTPQTLFVYWEISESDIINFKKQHGDNFFDITKPILIVHNLTLNTITEVEINDFANCWYINTEAADCVYDIELARKFIKKIESSNSELETREKNEISYIHIATSNTLNAPNDHILFEHLKEWINFRNTSTNQILKEHIKSYEFLEDIHEFYKKMYNDELLNNPSSKINF